MSLCSFKEENNSQSSDNYVNDRSHFIYLSYLLPTSDCENDKKKSK